MIIVECQTIGLCNYYQNHRLLGYPMIIMESHTTGMSNIFPCLVCGIGWMLGMPNDTVLNVVPLALLTL